MLYIILFPFVLYIALLVFSLRFRNPHTMCFVFGKKGSGKTCFMVHEIIKYAKKGWTIYTDIPIKYDNVRIINAKDIGKFVPDPHSLVCLDEVGITLGNRNYKSFTQDQIAFWKLQRHYHIRAILASQSWDADLKLRQLTDHMILQTNIGNIISVSRPIIRGITLTEPTSEGEARIADTLKFAPFWRWKFYYMPKYFKYFNSFEAPPKPPLPYVLSQLYHLTDKNVAKELQSLDSIDLSLPSDDSPVESA